LKIDGSHSFRPKTNSDQKDKCTKETKIESAVPVVNVTESDTNDKESQNEDQEALVAYSHWNADM
jgi:hypothetical protein